MRIARCARDFAEGVGRGVLGWRSDAGASARACVVLIAIVALSGVVVRAGEGDLAGQSGFDLAAFTRSASSNRVLRLGLAECIALTLRKNTEIRIKRIEPALNEQDLKAARAAFEPEFRAGASVSESPSASAAAGADSGFPRVTEGSVGVAGRLETGARYEAGIGVRKTEYPSAESGAGSLYSVAPQISATQPLLRGAGLAVNRAEIVIAANRKDMSMRMLRDTVIQSVSRALSAYLGCYYAARKHSIDEASLRRAEELLAINRARHAKGLVSGEDILEGEAAVAARRKALIAAEAAMLSAEDLLKYVTNLADDPELWNSRIEATDGPGLDDRPVDLVACLEAAFQHRPDYQAKLIDLANRDIQLQLAANARYPTLDLVGSLGLNGIGPELSDAWDRLDEEHKTFLVGVQLKVPWGGAERARLDRRKLEKLQGLLELRRLEQSIVLEVRDRVREVGIQRRQLEASRLARDAERSNYEAQLERYAAGHVSTHDILDYQDRLAAAELDCERAAVECENALVNLDKAIGLTLERRGIAFEYVGPDTEE